MTRKTHDGLARIQELLSSNPPDTELREIVDAQLRAHTARVTAIEQAWHNRRPGVVALLLATAACAGATILLWHAVEPGAFDLIAKSLSLFGTILVAVVLLVDDPFHESSAVNGWWRRLKLQGKCVAGVLVVTLVAGLLDVSTQQALDRDRDRAMVQIDDKIARVDHLLARMDYALKAAPGQIVAIGAGVEKVGDNVRTLDQGLNTVRRKLPELVTEVELRRITKDELRGATRGLATADMVESAVQAAVGDLAKTNDVAAARQAAVKEMTAAVKDLSRSVSESLTDLDQRTARQLKKLDEIGGLTTRVDGLAQAIVDLKSAVARLQATGPVEPQAAGASSNDGASR